MWSTRPVLLPVNLSIIKDPYDISSSSSELSPEMQIDRILNKNMRKQSIM